eukprot:Selendium_serpulae@DN3703_c0_g1_i2.p1
MSSSVVSVDVMDLLRAIYNDVSPSTTEEEAYHAETNTLRFPNQNLSVANNTTVKVLDHEYKFGDLWYFAIKDKRNNYGTRETSIARRSLVVGNARRLLSTYFKTGDTRGEHLSGQFIEAEKWDPSCPVPLRCQSDSACGAALGSDSEDDDIEDGALPPLQTLFMRPTVIPSMVYQEERQILEHRDAPRFDQGKTEIDCLSRRAVTIRCDSLSLLNHDITDAVLPIVDKLYFDANDAKKTKSDPRVLHSLGAKRGGDNSKRHMPSMPPTMSRASERMGLLAHLRECNKNPIIVIPAADSSFLNMNNAQDFFLNKRLTDSAVAAREVRRGQRENVRRFEWNLDLRSSKTLPAQPCKIEVVDDTSNFSSKDWFRTVAVITMGTQWEFQDWPLKQANDTFAVIKGYYMCYEEPGATRCVTTWGIPSSVKFKRDKRHDDASIWRKWVDSIEEFLWQPRQFDLFEPNKFKKSGRERR